MHKVGLILILTILMCGVLRADTLYLRDGSVLQGTFIGFENGQFSFQIARGDERNRGRTVTFPARDVVRLVIDRRPGGERDEPPRFPAPREVFDSFPAFDVQLVDQWTRSEIEVVRGQRLRVEASGQVYLEGRTPSTPDGLSRRDPDAPSPDAPDGALIAAIGKDPDSPAIFVGRSREFTADSDGMLYFTVNHSETRNARGSYRVRVSVERLGGARDTSPGRGSDPAPSRGLRERTITIYADRPWQDTGIEVEPGRNFEVTASGTIDLGGHRRVDAAGDRGGRYSSRRPLPEAGAGTLIAKIRYRQGGDSNILAVGTRNVLTAEPGEYGRLWLGINDDSFGDNSGSFTVRIRW
jgi:hypothetical protein